MEYVIFYRDHCLWKFPTVFWKHFSDIVPVAQYLYREIWGYCSSDAMKHLYALVLSLTDQSLRFEVFRSTWAEFYAFTQARSIDPVHVCGNAANLEYKTKWIFASVKQSYCPVLQIGCIPTDVQGVYRSCVEHIEFIMLELCGIHRYGISSRYGTIAAISKFRRKYYFVACLSYFNELALIQNLRRKSSFKRIVEVH